MTLFEAVSPYPEGASLVISSDVLVMMLHVVGPLRASRWGSWL